MSGKWEKREGQERNTKKNTDTDTSIELGAKYLMQTTLMFFF